MRLHKLMKKLAEDARRMCFEGAKRHMDAAKAKRRKKRQRQKRPKK